MGIMRPAAAGTAALALLLLPSGGIACAASPPQPPTPLPVGARLSASPGDRLTFTAPPGLPGMNGKWIVSTIFVQHGTLRMDDPVTTAVATVACDTPPGVYPVETNMPEGPAKGVKGNTWATVEVADLGEAERAACPAKVAALPPERLEERWPADASWPRSPWDVRTFRPGARVTPTAAAQGYDEHLISPGFTDEPVMRGTKAVVTATATIRCDAEPGLYEVRWLGRDEVWARYRVAGTGGESGGPCQDGAVGRTAERTAERAAERDAGRTPWLVGAAVAVLGLAGAAAYALTRRRRRERLPR